MVPTSTARGNPNGYLVDACLPKLEFLDEKDSKNYGISLTCPNSHNNRVSIETGMKNKQTEEKMSTHAPTCALWRVYYAQLPAQSRASGRFGSVCTIRTQADPVARA